MARRHFTNLSGNNLIYPGNLTANKDQPVKY
jgi:hypothetical protein